MIYAVLISSAAQRSIAAIPKPVRVRIDRAILGLAQDPRPHGCVKLTGTSNGWRIRVGDWRILYTIDDNRLTVLVVDAGHRREVYRGL